MSQTQRGKSSLDVLQSMINAILIETGKALRANNKESGKSLANVNSRLQTVIPMSIENFNNALDDLENDIVRAKSVLLRDLEEQRAKRMALENPAPIIDQVEASVADTMLSNRPLGEPAEAKETQAPSEATTKQENEKSQSPEKQAPTEPAQVTPFVDSTQDVSATTTDTAKGNNQGPTPPSSGSSKPIGLGINTEGTTAETGPATAEQQNSSIDSLFDDNNGSDMMFDGMDFLQDSNTIIQDGGQSQAQNTDFDLVNFGNQSQEFTMTDLHTSTQASNVNNSGANKQENDAFSTNTQSVDNMDIDFDLPVGEEGAFNDMYLDTNDLDHALDASFFDGI